jgi:hypothetical protein
MLYRGLVGLECVRRGQASFVSMMLYLHELYDIEWSVNIWERVGEAFTLGQTTGGMSLWHPGAAIR